MSYETITDEALEEAREMIGVRLRRNRLQWVDVATRDAIKHFAWGIGDDNPLWLDPEYARDSRWGRTIAPPTFLYSVDSTIVAPKLSGIQWIYAGTEWEFYRPVYESTEFDVDARLTDVQVKSGAFADEWVLQLGRVKYYNVFGDLMAEAVPSVARLPRGQENQKGKYEERTRYSYSRDELEEIEREILAEERRGDETRYWEDVDEGDRVPPVVKGPLTTTDIVAWYSAFIGAQAYGGAHEIATKYRQRHRDYHVDEETGAKDATGRGHLEDDMADVVGFGGAYDIGPQRISWAAHMLTNWMGDDGFVRSLKARLTMPNLVGDTAWIEGTVTDKFQENGNCGVRIEAQAINQRDEEIMPVEAEVLLPSRESGPVSFPLHPDG